MKPVHFGDFHDVFMFNRDARGEFADRALSQAIWALRRSCRLETIYQRIHRPFVAWQPSDSL